VVHCAPRAHARVWGVGPGADESYPHIAEAKVTKVELKREVASLRARLELRRTQTLDRWKTLPHDVRDGLAARALADEWGDHYAALVRLGFPPMSQLSPREVDVYADHVTCIFKTAGVLTILRREFAGIEAERAALLARQVQIALYGPDDASTRAFEGLARVCGWTARPGSPTTVTDGAA
jgi:hypothetical protein